jgi:hypothetical protein
MKLRRLSVMPLVVVVTTAILVPRISRADDTNAARVIDFEFQNAPGFAAIAWLTRLTATPVIVPADVTFQFSYRTPQKITRQEAIDALSNIFRTNGLDLAKVNDSYYRLTKASVPSLPTPRLHIDVELRDDQFFINRSLVERAELSQKLNQLMTPGMEVWVLHSQSPTRDPSFNEGAELLRTVRGLDVNRIYTVYMPSAH